MKTPTDGARLCIDGKLVDIGEPLLFDPGTQWSYSNAGFIVLGLVIEHVAKAVTTMCENTSSSLQA